MNRVPEASGAAITTDPCLSSETHAILGSTQTFFLLFFCGRTRMPDTKGNVTQLLHSAAAGNADAADALWSSVNDELRQMAAGHLRNHRGSITLTPTVVLQEVYTRIVDDQGIMPQWDNRRHFFGSIARAMSQFLIDHARHRGRLKRGGDRKRVPFEIAAGELSDASTFDDDRLTMVMKAFQKLQDHFPQQAAVAWLRWVQGWTVAQTAEALEVSTRTVTNEWRLAQAWLRREMHDIEEN